MASLKPVGVLVCGVGGQGTILASDLLCDVALAEGYDVKKTDSLGMSQRGGSVVSHVRMGGRVLSPLIPRGEADVLLAFEKLEAARYAPFLKVGGIAIVNDQAIPPLLVSEGRQEYPGDEAVRRILAERTQRQFFVAGEATARTLGNVRVLNLVMLGFLSAFLPLSQEAWRQCIPSRVPPRFLDLNLKAFAMGRSRAQAEGSKP